MGTRNENIVPYTPIHPGSILKEELKARKIRHEDFANQTGMQAHDLNALLNGRRDISAEIASELENTLGIPSVEWLSMQASYDHDRKTIAERKSKHTTYADYGMTEAEKSISHKSVIINTL